MAAETRVAGGAENITDEYEACTSSPKMSWMLRYRMAAGRPVELVAIAGSSSK